MKAIQVSAHGGAEQLKFTEVSDPRLGDNEVLVRVSVAGVNFIDIYQRTGVYPMQLPFIPGLEGAGEVIKIGSLVKSLKVGDRVAWPSSPSSYAQLIAIAEDRLVKVPGGVSLEDATAAMLQAMTAHYLVRDTYSVGPGSTCLVHAGAGGVGLLLIQMIRNLDGAVIATASTSEKRAMALEAGANHVASYEDFPELVREVTGGLGVDVVYDGVGRATFDKSLESLKKRGLMVLFGASSGAVELFDLQRLNRLGSLFITRPSLVDYISTEKELTERSAEIFGWLMTGSIKLKIGARFSLAEASKAHEALESRITSGKVLLIA